MVRHSEHKRSDSSDWQPPGARPSIVVPSPMQNWELALLTLLGIGLCALLAYPFLPAIAWAVALAVISWPLHRWLLRHVTGRHLGAVITTTAVAVLVLVPGLFVGYQLAAEAGVAAERARQEPSEQPITESMKEVPVLRSVVGWMERVGLDLDQEVRKLVASYTRDLSAFLQGSLAAAAQFLMMLFILYYLFLDRAAFLEKLRDLLPMTRQEADLVATRAADSIYANLYATTLTSLIDAVSGGLVFWVLGLPNPFIWGAVVFVLAILPIVGSALVWLPTAVYLALTGQWQAAAILVVWGLCCFVFVDTLLYIRLAGRRMNLHDVPALVAFFGGLAIFGISGMILGPVVFAVTLALLEVWRQRRWPANVEIATLKENEAASPKDQRLVLS